MLKFSELLSRQNTLGKNNIYLLYQKGESDMKKRQRLILSLFFFLISFSPICFYGESKSYKFIDGEDWNYIEGLDIEEPLKIKIKVLILRATHESSVIANTPVIDTTKPIIDYLPTLDVFYDAPENQPLPLYFALQIVDMQQKGAAGEKVEVYKSNLIRKLKEAGVIHESKNKDKPETGYIETGETQENSPTTEEPQSFWDRIFGQ